MEKKKVLIVDDDEVFVEAISAVLETRYRTETAANGAAALEKVKQSPPDVIVLDVMMDHVTEGFCVARTLKRNPRTQDIPIIMLTGVDRVYNIRMEVDGSWVPCDKYLEKPVSPEDLLDHVANLIG